MNDRTRQFVEQFRAGKTLAEIGEEAGISRERVRQVLSRAGYGRRDGGASLKTRRREEAAVALLNEGFTREEAADRLGYRVTVGPSVLEAVRAEARFWKFVDKSGGPESCWLWRRGLTAGGYGHTRRGYAHRRAFEYHYRPEVMPAVVRNICGTHACCNPAHLRGGSQADCVRGREEMADLSRRVRWSPATTEARDKLILQMVAEGMKQTEIGKRLGVSQSNVNHIIRRLRLGLRPWQVGR